MAATAYGSLRTARRLAATSAGAAWDKTVGIGSALRTISEGTRGVFSDDATVDVTAGAGEGGAVEVTGAGGGGVDLARDFVLENMLEERSEDTHSRKRL